MERKSGEIDVYDLEAGRMDVSKGGTFVSIAENAAFKKAVMKKLLNVPLILWDKTVDLRPSPFKRIYKELCRIMPKHRLRVNSVKAMYRKLRSKYVRVKNVTKNKERTTMELVNRLQNKTKTLKNKMKEEKRRVYIDWNETSSSSSSSQVNNESSTPSPLKKGLSSIRSITKRLATDARRRVKNKTKRKLKIHLSKRSNKSSLSSQYVHITYQLTHLFRVSTFTSHINSL